ncbi:peptidylprolyl isomerase [Tenacibaculum sp. IB213877]|uniref:peptidylprolyl isomerase n=1 Tax=Tenacibaculum sp. IB213877 TaxID=3097351 RepID=UPI002A5A2F55|nr:peptidylprolyl isomerase [Tenacibaculum sp. IB213877]MDY0779854.1 peptidylprolyl isomerase [Tenacibaculum sp. IB213877]
MVKSIKLLIVLSLVLSACKSVKYPELSNGLYADIQTNRGDILVKLHEKDVPMTVANFVSLAEGNNPKLPAENQDIPFYNGIKFHRVIKDFMIQGGDPTGTGRGNAGYRFDDEFPMDEEGELLLKHDGSGVLSMANSGPNTNSSQFFITINEAPWLNGRHSVFGQVQFGQEVVDSIQQNDYIKAIEIIRIGSEAKKFDAPTVFQFELNNSEARRHEYKRKLAIAKNKFKEKMGIAEAFKTESGLKILTLQEGTGKKVNPAIPTTVHYTLYTADGKKIDSSISKEKPFVFTINKDPLIAGWKEGASRMAEGEKSRLFIPSYLGYGSVGRPPIIDPNTDLIFEIEILKVGK